MFRPLSEKVKIASTTAVGTPRSSLPTLPFPLSPIRPRPPRHTFRWPIRNQFRSPAEAVALGKRITVKKVRSVETVSARLLESEHFHRPGPTGHHESTVGLKNLSGRSRALGSPCAVQL